MYSILITFFIIKYYFFTVKKKQLSLWVYIPCLGLIYLTVFYNFQSLIILDSFLFNRIKFILTFPVYGNIKINFILFLSLLLLTGLNSNKIIGKFADFYVLFLLDAMDLKQKTIPYRFVAPTTLLGSFIGRQVSIYLDFSATETFVIVFVFGCLTCPIIYGVLVGFFFLASSYSKSWGNTVFSYLINKTSLTVKKKVGINSRPLKQKVKTKSCLKKISKFGKSGGLKKPQKRSYSK